MTAVEKKGALLALIPTARPGIHLITLAARDPISIGHQ